MFFSRLHSRFTACDGKIPDFDINMQALHGISSLIMSFRIISLDDIVTMHQKVECEVWIRNSVNEILN